MIIYLQQIYLQQIYEVARIEEKVMMSHVISKDGTRIAWETIGQGPVVLIVNGAFGYRAFRGGRDLASLLSNDFTVCLYDSRGRGQRTDTPPYAAEREIEDIEALIDQAGGSAYVYGDSSGAALTLLAAASLGSIKIPKVALYDPPYVSDDDKARHAFAAEKQQITALLRQGKRGDATAFCYSDMGIPPARIEEIQKQPDWKLMESVEHTLAYEYTLLGDGTVPLALARKTMMPALVMDGEKSMPFMHEAAETLGKAMPQALRKTLKDQTHSVSAPVLAPVLKAFFRS